MSSMAERIRRFREAPPTSPTKRNMNMEEDTNPRSNLPAPVPNTNYTEIVKSLKKSGNKGAMITSPSTSYSGLGKDDDFIAREIRQLKRDMHFNKIGSLKNSYDSTSDYNIKGLSMPDLRFSNEIDIDKANVLDDVDEIRQSMLHNSGSYSPPRSFQKYRFNNGDSKLRSSGETLGKCLNLDLV